MSDMITQAIYDAAHNTAVLTDRSDLGILKLSGETRLDLINRMSTQAVNQLKAGEGAATVLTTDIGRIIDRLILYASSDTVYALTGENNAEAIARYLMRFVFFNDDFRIEDLSGQTAVLGVYGPQSAAKLSQVGFPETDLPLHHWRQADLNGVTAYLHRTDPVAGDGYFVMCRLADKTAVWQQLLATGLVEADAQAFEALRVESGLPRFGYEMTNDYIPLETGLWDDVSFNKGCYIGQEIIARMESRGRLAKKLTILTADQPLSPGATILADGRQAGQVTSTAVLPNGSIALGYVKTAVLEKSPLMLTAENVTLRPA